MSDRTSVAKISLIDSDGSKAASPLDATGVKFEFYDLTEPKPADAPDDWKPPFAESRTFTLAELQESSPDDVDMIAGLAIHGLRAITQEAYSARKAKGLDAWAMVDDRMNNLRSGVWQEGRGEGVASSTTLVVEAICRALEKQGVTVTDAIREAARGATDSKDARKAALNDPEVKLAFLEIQEERAKKRLADAAAKAQAAGGSELLKAIGAATEGEAS